VAKTEPLRDSPEPRRRQEGDEKVVLRRREADWTDQERSSYEDTGFAVQRAAVDVAAAALAAHESLTAGHSDDVVTVCGALADRLELSDPQRARLLAAARLHDLGKVAVPQGVLEKPGPLDSTEWTLIRDHTVCGQRILQSVPELTDIGDIVRHSHERWDGAGYPDGLAGEEIPLESRIVFCADAFHAIRCDRPYRRGRSAAVALGELRRHSGTQFDPTVVEALEQEAASLRRSPSARLAAMTTTVRSKRLVALLLSLVVSGSALAAPGSPLRQGDGGPEAVASTSAGCADPCLRESIGALAASQVAATAQAADRGSGEASGEAPVDRLRAAADPAGGSAPASNDAGDHAERGDRRSAPSAPGSPPPPHQSGRGGPTPLPTPVVRRSAPASAPPPAEPAREMARAPAPAEPSPEPERADEGPSRKPPEGVGPEPGEPVEVPRVPGLDPSG